MKKYRIIDNCVSDPRPCCVKVVVKQDEQDEQGKIGYENSIVVAIDDMSCCCCCSCSSSSSSSWCQADFTIHCGGAWISLGPRVIGLDCADIIGDNAYDAEELCAFVSRYCMGWQSTTRVVTKRCGIHIDVLDDSIDIDTIHRDLTRLLAQRFRHMSCEIVSSRRTLYIRYPRATGHQLLERIVRAYEDVREIKHVKISCAAFHSKIVRHWGWSMYIDFSSTIPMVVL